MTDRVIIRVPASIAHVGLVRATASSLAAFLDFTYDRITDLHIAIDEACSRIMATADPHPQRIEISFDVESDGLRVEASADAAMKPGAVLLNVWSETILTLVTEELQISERDGIARLAFRVRRGGVD